MNLRTIPVKHCAPLGARVLLSDFYKHRAPLEPKHCLVELSPSLSLILPGSEFSLYQFKDVR
jgi:hypothetical protein